jgi:sirohydrochlorin cobaltochelatase
MTVTVESKTALILFAHGARDARWAAPFQRLQALTQVSLPGVKVELAFLEFMAPSLTDLVSKLVTEGCKKVMVSPIFLGQGGHVLRDLPIMISTLREQYPQLTLLQIEAAGEDANVLAAIRDYCVRSISQI